MFNEMNLQIELTTLCNLKCKHCYMEENGELVNKTDDILKYFEEYYKFLGKYNMKGNVALTGGEPLLYPKWRELIKLMRSKSAIDKVVIFTNGTLITESICADFKELRVDSVQISLDGGNRKVHDSIRGQGNFDKAIRAINLLKSRGIPVTTHFTIHNLNKDSFEELVDLCYSLEVPYILVSKLIPMGNGEALKEYCLSPEQWFEFYKENLHLKDKYGNKVVIEFDRLHSGLEKDDKNCSGCSLGGKTCTILSDGSVMPCRRIPKVIGNLNEKSLNDIWFRSMELWKLRDRKRLKGHCKCCEYVNKCGGCRANAYGVYGDIYEQDPYCLKQLEGSITYENTVD